MVACVITFLLFVPGLHRYVSASHRIAVWSVRESRVVAGTTATPEKHVPFVISLQYLCHETEECPLAFAIRNPDTDIEYSDKAVRDVFDARCRPLGCPD